ncbi:hypothetical protein Zmor_002167 [Zophobas morio]|uniref:Uncharacterized protein n=1 Tax=Zophobas morio TaxID=2755281 RepID=A0AA38J0I3_9CUCU|nr:hypothetical protein Zmor_002167 [Zophobas morio]
MLRTQFNENLYNSYLSKVTDSIENYPQVFWKCINDRKKVVGSGIPCEMHNWQEFAKTGTEISNLFAEFFSSVYVEDANSDFDQEFECINEVSDSGLKVDISEAFENVTRLKHSFHHGADGIPKVPLKNCIYSSMYSALV